MKGKGNHMRFINDDIVLVHDQRNAPYSKSKISLLNKIIDLAKNLGHIPDESNGLLTNADVVAGRAIKTILRKDPILNQDNTYMVDVENFMCNFYRQNQCDIGNYRDLIGLHEFDNGLTFYGFVAGGDGQRSVFMMIYDDGDHLRLYTPRWGNKLNLNRQEPLMNDSRSEKYMARYGLDQSTLGFNWNAMKIDILANFTIDYRNVVESHLRAIQKEEEAAHFISRDT
jgi:hypothetical protein